METGEKERHPLRVYLLVVCLLDSIFQGLYYLVLSQLPVPMTGYWVSLGISPFLIAAGAWFIWYLDRSVRPREKQESTSV